MALHALGVQSIDEFQDRILYLIDGVLPDEVGKDDINKGRRKRGFMMIRMANYAIQNDSE